MESPVRREEVQGHFLCNVCVYVCVCFPPTANSLNGIFFAMLLCAQYEGLQTVRCSVCLDCPTLLCSLNLHFFFEYIIVFMSFFFQAKRYITTYITRFSPYSLSAANTNTMCFSRCCLFVFVYMVRSTVTVFNMEISFSKISTRFFLSFFSFLLLFSFLSPPNTSYIRLFPLLCCKRAGMGELRCGVL